MWIAIENVFKDCASGYMPNEEVRGIHIDADALYSMLVALDHTLIAEQ